MPAKFTLFALFLGSSLAPTSASRVSTARLISSELLESPDEVGAEIEASCVAGETYGLDDKGQCRDKDSNDAPDECCLDCIPDATYGRDAEGRCRTDINNNGVLDRFANGECCECDSSATYGRDNNGRCRTDVNNNGLLDRFAKDVCCGDKVAYGPGVEFTFQHPKYGAITTTEQCESKELGDGKDERMSNRNANDCIGCVTEGSQFIKNRARCVADESAATITQEEKEDEQAAPAAPMPVVESTSYRFAGRYATPRDCETITVYRINPNMQRRMTAIMYADVIKVQRAQARKDCEACVTGKLNKMSSAHAAKCQTLTVSGNLVPFPSRPGGDMMTMPDGCPQRNPGNPVTWVVNARKCVQSQTRGITVHGSSTTGSISPMPPMQPTKCCKTASKCPEASVKIPEKVPDKYTIKTLTTSGECVAADGAGKPTPTVVENVCCESD